MLSANGPSGWNSQHDFIFQDELTICGCTSPLLDLIPEWGFIDGCVEIVICQEQDPCLLEERGGQCGCVYFGLLKSGLGIEKLLSEILYHFYLNEALMLHARCLNRDSIADAAQWRAGGPDREEVGSSRAQTLTPFSTAAFTSREREPVWPFTMAVLSWNVNMHLCQNTCKKHQHPHHKQICMC